MECRHLAAPAENLPVMVADTRFAAAADTHLNYPVVDSHCRVVVDTRLVGDLLDRCLIVAADDFHQ